MSWDDRIRLCFSNLWNRLSQVKGEKYLDFNKECADDLLEAFLKLEFRSLTRLIGSDTGGI